MKMEHDVKFHQGIGDLYFGMPIEETIQKFGKASEVEVLDSIEDIQTTILHYSERDLALFFEEQEPTLKCIDTSNPETVISGMRIFEKTEKEIVELMKQMQFFEQDIEIESWGEKRISFFEANADYFFHKGKLISLVLGK